MTESDLDTCSVLHWEGDCNFNGFVNEELRPYVKMFSYKYNKNKLGMNKYLLTYYDFG